MVCPDWEATWAYSFCRFCCVSCGWCRGFDSTSGACALSSCLLSFSRSPSCLARILEAFVVGLVRPSVYSWKTWIKSIRLVCF